ncbi:MAG TPA: acyl-CoA reductase [Flavisolibacter sp.]|nr:acyl-CoA reductase [Flavisolibacter sp.]
MNLQERKSLLARLSSFIQSDDKEWVIAKEQASAQNSWFIPEFIELSVTNIANQYVAEKAVEKLIATYHIPEQNPHPKKVGIVMAGNIPLVGFHDLLCTFLTGNYARIKPSSKDDVLLKAIIKKLAEWNEETLSYFNISALLKGCDAYIATGSNNSSSYFEYYFNKYPHIIRKNRTSVAILTGEETDEELEALADDVYQYFGLGCRNVTKLFVPKGYDFERMLTIFKKYNYLSNHQKFKNNYDYNLAIHLLNHKYYMSNESLLVIEDASLFSPISQLNYEYYSDIETARNSVTGNEKVQCVVEKSGTAFGQAQQPGLFDFADGVDTMKFLMSLS